MSITNDTDMEGIKRISEVVATTLFEMHQYAKPGMSTLTLDEFGGRLLEKMGARSAPLLTYNFPGHTCISLNNEIAHGIPSATRILQEGDLLNIDVSAEKDGYWSDNGSSVIIGVDVNGHQQLVDASKAILKKALRRIKAGLKIAELGGMIELEAKKSGYTVIKNLTGHGVGRGLHEAPFEIPNFYDHGNRERFKKNSVVAVEVFISTGSTIAETLPDGWTLVGNKAGVSVQYEHTVMVTDGLPVILTETNGIWN